MTIEKSRATVTILGSSTRPWRAADWRAVDDRIRGGSSQSHLDADGRSARFYGSLDTSTLGGAGFASQTCERAVKLPRSRFTGLRIHVLSEDDSPSSARPHSFVFNLKTTAPERRPDGRLESRLTYEYEFDGGRAAVLDAPWHAFAPTYRGRPANNAPALDPSQILELSIMCRSNFDKQSGPFSVRLGAVEAVFASGADTCDDNIEAAAPPRGFFAWLAATVRSVIDTVRSFFALPPRHGGLKL